MATIVRKNLKDRVKNDTFSSVNFTVKDGLGVAIDLTDVAIHIQFRYRCKTGSVVKDIEVASGITLRKGNVGGVPQSKVTLQNTSIDEFTSITFTFIISSLLRMDTTGSIFNYNISINILV